MSGLNSDLTLAVRRMRAADGGLDHPDEELDSWFVTNDETAILEADPEDLVFIDDLMVDYDHQLHNNDLIEQVADRIEQAYPACPAGFVRAHSRPNRVALGQIFRLYREPQDSEELARKSGNNHQRHAKWHVLVDKAIEMDGEPVECQYNTLQGYGNDPWSSSGWSPTKELAEARGVYYRFSKARNRHELVYNPKVTERRIKKREMIAKGELPAPSSRAHIMLDLLSGGAWQPGLWLRQFFPRVQVSSNKRRMCCANMPKLHVLMNYVYGENSILMVEGFALLLEAWERDGVRKATKERYLEDARNQLRKVPTIEGQAHCLQLPAPIGVSTPSSTFRTGSSSCTRCRNCQSLSVPTRLTRSTTAKVRR